MSERLGSVECIADQSPRENVSLFLPFDTLPERDYTAKPSKNRTSKEQPPVDWAAVFDRDQLSLEIASQFDGIRFRSSSRDQTSYGLATPVDKLTRIPLPILYTEAPHTTANTDFWDYHHHFHPEKELIHADDATLALRRSRGQYLPRWLHEHYHHYFAGPELQYSREQIFQTVVLACAGVVPRQALDFSSYQGPKIVDIPDNDTYQAVAESIKHEGERNSSIGGLARAQIGIFFANYAIEQSFEEVISQKVIGEFLSTRDTARRKVLGNLMIREAIHLSVEPILPTEKTLKENGVMRKRQTDLRELIKDYFVRSRQPQYYQAIDRKLLVA